MADLQMQKMIELQRECRSEIGIEKGAPLVPTRFILWLVDRVQKLEQCSVMRWQDFKEQKPIDGQSVLIVNFKTGQAIVSEWQTKYELLMKEDDKWIPSPAIV